MDLLSLRLVGAVGARINVRSFPQGAFSTTRTGTPKISILHEPIALAIERSQYLITISDTSASLRHRGAQG